MDEPRDSLLEFQSSIFDASDGHALVEFIRKKKGLRSQPKKIFDDIRKERQSLQIEIQRLDDVEKTLQNAAAQEQQPEHQNPEDVGSTDQSAKVSGNNSPNRINSSPRSTRLSPSIDAKKKLKRLSNKSIGRRTLLKEFEKTLQESRFLPQTCSTPLNSTAPQSASPVITHIDENQFKGTTQEKSLNQNIFGGALPITISDEDEVNGSRRSATNNTENLMQELQKENDFLIDLAKEDLLTSLQNIPQCDEQHNNEEIPPLTSPERPPSTLNRTSTPVKEDNRRTFTVHRDNISGKLILTPRGPRDESIREPLRPTSPHRNLKTNKKKLLATPEQKKLLLSRFGHNAFVSVQKSSRIPVMTRSANNQVENASPSHVYENKETSQLIEQLKRNAPSNTPVIVIPVNQTFNQAPAPAPAPPVPAPAPPPAPVPTNVTQTVEETPAPATPVPASPPAPAEKTPPRRDPSPVIMDNLRLNDIITDDESSDTQPLSLVRRKRRTQDQRKSVNTTKRSSNPNAFKLSLHAPPPSNPTHVRNLVTSNDLAHLTHEDVLDLRKRNSQGELRQTFNLTERESSMLDKQIELELLRRSIQKDNIENEVSRMEVVPPPPDEFRDQQESSRQMDSSRALISTSEDNFVDERSSDKISLNPNGLSQVDAARKPRRKKKKMSEQLEKYLTVSQRLSRSKYLNQSKRKLYSKGQSDASTSDDSSPHRSIHIPRQSRSPRKSSNKSRRKNFSHSRIDSRKSSAVSNSRSPPSDLSSPQRPVTRHSLTKRSSKSGQSVQPSPAKFKKPIGRPPKSKRAQKKAQPARNHIAASNSSVSSSRSPVEPDNNMDMDHMPRRSKRERKPPTAYWSCSQKEFRPLFDVNMLFPRNQIHEKKGRKNTSKLPDKGGGSLVESTTNVTKATSVKPGQTKKQSNKKQKRQPEQKTADMNTKPTDEPNSESRSCHSSPQLLHNKQTTIATKNAPHTTNNSATGSQAMRITNNSANDSQTIGTTNNNSRLQKSLRRAATPSSECQSEDLEFAMQSTLRIGEVQVEKQSQPKLIGPKSKRKQLLIRAKRLQSSDSSDQESNRKLTKSQSESQIQNHSSMFNIQPTRLTTVIENSASELFHQQPASVCDSDNVEPARLSGLLMPPPKSLGVERKKPAKRPKKDAFRTEHDESIADASTLHVNKLFDQLKSSSMCVTADATHAEQKSGSGQASRDCLKDIHALRPRCKKLAVRVARVNSKKLPQSSSDRICDSGFSSEDMTSDPKEKSGDILLNWLKQILRNNRTPVNQQKGVAKFLQWEGFRVANIDNLIFQELNGVDFAFYDTGDAFSFGYIRFNPKTEKKRSTAKKFELNFVVLCGTVKITANNNTFDCKNGDLITVFIGTTYSMKNISNDPALVMVIKK